MERKRFVFEADFYDAIMACPEEARGRVYHAIATYALKGECVELEGVERIAFLMAKPKLDADIRRYENGCRGGCPKGSEKPSMKGNKNALKPGKNKTKTKPKQNQNKTKTKPNNSISTDKPTLPITDKHILLDRVIDSISIDKPTLLSTDKRKLSDRVGSTSTDEPTPSITDKQKKLGRARNTASTDKKNVGAGVAHPRPCFFEIEREVEERGYTFPARKFYEYYEARGWKCGGRRLADWKAKMRDWQATEPGAADAPAPEPGPAGRKYVAATVFFKDGHPFVRQFGVTDKLPDDFPPQPGEDYYWDVMWNGWRKG